MSSVTHQLLFHFKKNWKVDKFLVTLPNKKFHENLYRGLSSYMHRNVCNFSLEIHKKKLLDLSWKCYQANIGIIFSDGTIKDHNKPP
jgi:hypothetical protein